MTQDKKPGEQLTIRFIPAATREPLLSVGRESSLAEAKTLMELYDFSQLPVLQNGRAVGVISWENIGRALSNNSDATLKECINHDVPMVKLSSDLLLTIPIINKHGFVVVVNDDKTVSGIVTGADLGETLAGIAGPFMNLEKIETALRRILDQLRQDDRISETIVESALSASSKTASRLSAEYTFGELESILCFPAVWDELASKYERKALSAMLQAASRLRNCLMHFRDLTIEDKNTIEVLPNLVKVVESLEAAQYT